MDGQKTSFLLSKHAENLPNLHNTITKYFLELQDQRNELKTLKSKLATETRCKNDLQIDIKLYVKELNALRSELKVAIATVNKKQSKDELFTANTRMHVNYEQVSSENHRLIQQLQTLNNKLVDAMCENNDLCEEVRVLRLNQSSYMQKHAEVWKDMAVLKQHLERVELNQKSICKIHDSSRLLAMRAEKSITFYKNQLDAEQQVNERLRDKLLAAESQVAKQNAKADAPQSKDYPSRDFVERQLRERIQKLEADLNFEKNERKKLADSFTKMTAIQEKLNHGLEKVQKTSHFK